MLRITLPVALLAGIAATAAAQNGRGAVSAVESQWRGVTTHITTVAEETAEADYGWRPIGTVRTIGEMVAHVAGAQNLICAAALGESPRAEDEFEGKGLSKAALVAALKASTEYCGRAFAQTDAALQAQTPLFGQESTRFGALVLNAMHNGEHYGNLVTYYRIRGQVPPSSRP